MYRSLRYFEKWRCGSFCFSIGCSWKCVFSVTTRLLKPTPWKKAASILSIGGWVYPRICLDVLEKRKISCLATDLTAGPPLYSPQPSHYIDWAIQFPSLSVNHQRLRQGLLHFNFVKWNFLISLRDAFRNDLWGPHGVSMNVSDILAVTSCTFGQTLRITFYFRIQRCKCPSSQTICPDGGKRSRSLQDVYCS